MLYCLAKNTKMTGFSVSTGSRRKSPPYGLGMPAELLTFSRDKMYIRNIVKVSSINYLPLIFKAESNENSAENLESETRITFPTTLRCACELSNKLYNSGLLLT